MSRGAAAGHERGAGRAVVRTVPLVGRLRRDRSGQALVEFAIVAPLFVIVLLFSLWLWELIQIKLKLQEAARYAAWEATAYQLHSYMDNFYSQGNAFNTASAQITADATLRFMDLDSLSATPQKAYLTLSSWGTTDQETGSWNSSVKVLVPSASGDWLNMVSGMRLLQMVGFPVMGGDAGIGVNQLSGNELEEILPGGQLANTVAGLLGPVVSLLQSASYLARPGGRANAVATALIGINRAGDATFGAAGTGMAGAARLLGSPTWGFNRRGYVKAHATVSVRNDWFGVTVLGQPIFSRKEIELREEHGLLADAWDLNQPGAVHSSTITDKQASSAGGWGTLGKLTGWALGAFKLLTTSLGMTPAAPGGYQEQLERMFFMHPRAKSVAKAFMRTFVEAMNAAALSAGGGMPLAWRDDKNYFFPALASHPYAAKDDIPAGKSQPGWVGLDEDALGGKGGDGKMAHPMYYNSAPLIGAYAEALRQRGKYFMGCPDAEQLGCQRGLAQANPFADYVYRE